MQTLRSLSNPRWVILGILLVLVMSMVVQVRPTAAEATDTATVEAPAVLAGSLHANGEFQITRSATTDSIARFANFECSAYVDSVGIYVPLTTHITSCTLNSLSAPPVTAAGAAAATTGTGVIGPSPWTLCWSAKTLMDSASSGNFWIYDSGCTSTPLLTAN